MTTRRFVPLAVASRIPSWIDVFIVAALCIAAALSVPSQWHVDLKVPFLTGGDAMSAQYLIKTVMEHGWYTSNPDVGVPFGATMYDYPIPEPTHFLLIRLLGLISNDPYVVFNLFYLFSFASAASAAWWGLRKLGMERPLAIAGAFLFTILPYHFLRLPHLYLASYFAAAIFATYALRIALFRAPHLPAELRLSFASLLLIAIAAGSGVYYAFFACVFIAVGTVFGAVQSGRREPIYIGLAYILVIVGVIGLSLLPNVIYHAYEGSNALVAQRYAKEADIYGLRLTQLMLPSIGHRISSLGLLTHTYNVDAGASNESAFASLGIVGSIGLLGSVLFGLFGDRKALPVVVAAGVLSIAGILFAAVGGAGSLFAFLVTPALRGLNRISVFLAFLSIVSALVLARRLIGSHSLRLAALGVLLLAVGWFDEIPARAIARQSSIDFRQQQVFFDKVQANLPSGTSVFQLPYMYFPESGPQAALTSYSLLEPYLRTRGLRWSFGDMHGRPADMWNEQVSSLDGAELVHALSGSGFGAIYVDGRGYSDHGAAINRSLAAVLGAPVANDTARTFAVYRIPSQAPHSVAPFIVVGPGREWYTWGKSKSGEPVGLSKGSSELIVANPGAATQAIVKFKITSTVTRHFTVRYRDQVLASYGLAAGDARDFVLNIHALEGISKLYLDTDAPAAALAPNDPRRVAFRIDDLAYGAAAP